LVRNPGVQGVTEHGIPNSRKEGNQTAESSLARIMNDRKNVTETTLHCDEAMIGSDLEELARVRSFIRGFCKPLEHPSLDEEGIGHLELALTEAAANVIKHAYGGETGRRIRISAELSPAHLTVDLCHRGQAFDPEEVPEPSFDGSKDGGFGLFIIRQCVNELSFFQDGEGRNCMRMVINLICLGKGGSHGDPC
jgi:anti-sigma regulatory factor (Ser/Thr protein kinase)